MTNSTLQQLNKLLAAINATKDSLISKFYKGNWATFNMPDEQLYESFNRNASFDDCQVEFLPLDNGCCVVVSTFDSVESFNKEISSEGYKLIQKDTGAITSDASTLTTGLVLDARCALVLKRVYDTKRKEATASKVAKYSN